MDVMQMLAGVPGVGPYLPILALVVAVCAAIAAAVPAPSPAAPVLWVVAYRVLNVLGANVGRARNADDVPPAVPGPVGYTGAGVGPYPGGGPAGGGGGRIGAAIVLAPFLAGLAACSDGGLSPGSARAVAAACMVDQVLQPITVALAPALVPGAAGLVALDRAAIHPAIMAACAAIGGLPVVPVGG